MASNKPKPRIEPHIGDFDLNLEVDTPPLAVSAPKPGNPYGSPRAAGPAPAPIRPPLFGFHGRLSVGRYWLLHLSFAVTLPVLAAVLLLQLQPVIGYGLLFGVGASLLASAGYSLSLLVRRLHDLGMSGWWTLLWPLPVVGQFFALFVALLPGSRGANGFGPANPPLSWPLRLFTLALFAAVLVGAAVVVEVYGGPLTRTLAGQALALGRGG